MKNKIEVTLLNLIWVSFFIIAFITALTKFIFSGNTEIFSHMMQACFQMSKLAFEISLGLVGVMAFWLGIMKIGEMAGFFRFINWVFGPLFARLFPSIPKNHPAMGAMVMNMSANVLGMDNAATPLGLKAMKELQSLNTSEETASDDQILFLVLNTSSLTLFPVVILSYRAQLGASHPTDVFIPILIATFVSSLTGLFLVSIKQNLKLYDRVAMLYGLIMLSPIVLIIFYFLTLDATLMQSRSTLISNLFLWSVVLSFISIAAIKKVDVFRVFIEGAKEGFQVAVTIIPYLVAMLVGIGVFRASGALDIILEAVRSTLHSLKIDTRFVEGLPTALMKPLSGSGSRGMMVDAIKTHGADSFVGRLVAIMQGSTETTFYVLALYFGSVRVVYYRHAVSCALLADVAGISTAIIVCYFFYG